MVPNNFVFIRAKTIKNKKYGYLVQNDWHNGRAKQRVIQYLGKILTPDQTEPKSFPNSKPEQLIQAYCDHETQSLDIEIDYKTKTIKRNKRSVVIEMNGGFLCDHTLQLIFDALGPQDEPRPGKMLAKAFSNAGVRIFRDDFIRLYMGYVQ